MTQPVLIVEDNGINTLVLRTMLQRAGYATIEAVDGLDALAKARAHDPALILMDLMMPRMDGIQAAREILATNRPRRPKIVAVTGSVSNEQRRACIEAGFDGFMAKPVDFSELLETVARLLAAGDTTTSTAAA